MPSWDPTGPARRPPCARSSAWSPPPDGERHHQRPPRTPGSPTRSTQVGVMLEAASHPARSARNHLRVLAAEGGSPTPPRADELLRARRPRRRRGPALRRLLARHDASGSASQAALPRRPADPGARRARQRARPRGHPLAARLPARPGSRGRTVLLSSHVLSEVEPVGGLVEHQDPRVAERRGPARPSRLVMPSEPPSAGPRRRRGRRAGASWSAQRVGIRPSAARTRRWLRTGSAGCEAASSMTQPREQVGEPGCGRPLMVALPLVGVTRRNRRVDRTVRSQEADDLALVHSKAVEQARAAEVLCEGSESR